LAQRLIAIGVALGGRAGSRLGHHLGYSISDNTLLALLATVPLPAIQPPTVLGVDDFAFAKRQSYGTILVDLERRRPIALLKDREANTLAQWLEQHPGAEVLSRDRSAVYRSGMDQGAPHAMQVADRFHLLQNLTQVLEQALGNQAAVLKAADTAQRLANAPAGAAVMIAAATPAQPDAQQRAERKRAQRLKAYQKIWQLHQAGWSTGAIAKKVRLSNRTVQRYLNTPSFPERQGRSDRGRSLLNPYKAYLLQQYNQGRRQVKRLFQEIQKQGYSGSYMTVSRYVRQIAQAQAVTLRQYPSRRLPPVVDSPRPPLTPRRAAFLVLRRAETLPADETQLVQRLAEQPELAPTIALAQDFAQLVRHRRPEQLDFWLEHAEQSDLAPFVRFARSLREDYDAVKAGVTYTASNGQVEGQINRLKMLKRQMYGRAGIELLERRFLFAS
jgi:transposase